MGSENDIFNNEDCCTDFLFSKPSFLTGMGTAINLWGNSFDYNYSRTDEDADDRAINCDWKMVGRDLRKVLSEIL